MNFVIFVYGIFMIAYAWISEDIPDSVMISSAILIGCFMISESLNDIKSKIKKE